MAIKTVAGWLVELKLLDKRINKAVSSGTFVQTCVGGKVSAQYKDKKTLESMIKSDLQSVMALIENRQKIKAALVISNATTNVVVGGKSMTVASAIETKSSINSKKSLLYAMGDQLNNMLSAMKRCNTEAQQRLDKLLEASFGKDTSKASKEEMEGITKPFMENNECSLVNPLDIKVKMEELSKEIEDFEANVDLALSTSNAITEVEVDIK